jgi:putative peptidoglycan lipid II flippase
VDIGEWIRNCGAVVSEKRSIARAAGIVSSLTLLSRVTGLIRDVLISYLFGAGMAAEAFFVAFRFPNFFRRLVAEGAMSVAIVPVFSDLLASGRRAEAERGLRALVAMALLLLVGLAALGTGLAPLWIEVFAPGFAGSPELQDLAVRLTRLLFPYLVLIGAVAVLAGYLNACRHFVAPALSPALLNLVVISTAVALYPLLEEPVDALAYGVLAGGTCQLALQVVALRRRRVALWPSWEPGHEAVRRSFALLLPATFGTAIFQVNVLVATVLASMLPVGSISYLWYADRVFEFPLGLFVAALGTAALPSMASQAARGELAGLRESLVFALALMNLVAVPATVGLVLLAEPITALLFERGAFGPNESLMTARALRCYAVGLWPVAAVRLLAPAFYALGDPRTPVRAAVLTVLVNIVASIALMGPVPAEGGPAWLTALVNRLTIFDLDHAGVALATSIAAMGNATLLGILLLRRLGGSGHNSLLASVVRSVVASIPLALVVQGGAHWLSEPLAGGLAERAASLAATIAAGVVAFAVAALLLGGREVDRARELVVERLTGRGAK